ncbi:hypothetical protein PV328_012237 [Microctonus aethiopoides]|uniref:Reverse transcriptase RNase H-like domain-containing protein n=1 Tax=Microctonus aethiopoides TaxID=144406 RepID=A0AA39KPN4_9HYME|nr:hypothetical protein PV328_012237 [Microctonus aethiopoides]
MRWRERLKEFDFTVCYKAGKVNTNADALLRNPVESKELNMIRGYHKLSAWENTSAPEKEFQIEKNITNYPHTSEASCEDSDDEIYRKNYKLLKSM